MSDPTLLVVPEGGIPSPPKEVDAILDATGVELDPWQRSFLDHSLARAADGRWSAFEVGLVVPRQNGKNAILEIRQLLGLFTLGERLAVHSAHDYKTAQEHHRRLAGLVEATPSMSKKIRAIRWAHGSEAIELKNGCRIRFLARSRSAGRGFSADSLYFDEAFRLDSEMVGGVLPILSARKDPQLWVVSSAPQHQSEYLHSLLARADSGGDGRLLCAEWGNPQDTELSDQTAWVRANPALGIRISFEHVEAELKSLGSTLMGQAEFARERLGVRDEFGPAEWETFDQQTWMAVTGQLDKEQRR